VAARLKPGAGTVPQLQNSKEFMKEEGAAVVRQTRMIKANLDVSGRSQHCAII